jgi:hypothetical protein
MSCLDPRSQTQIVVSLLETLATRRRPPLLLTAARLAQGEYRRDSDLRRILRLPAPPAPGPGTVQLLLDLEARCEHARQNQTGDAWRAARHVEILTALLAEARLLRAGFAQMNASGSDALRRAT